MSPETCERVIQFVSMQTRINAQKLTLSSTLFQDLGIDGDDAIDLLRAFSEEFRVDLSELDPKQHFGPEGFGPSAIFLWLFSILGIERSELTPISLSDLAEAAEAGRWIKSMPKEPRSDAE